MMPPMVAWLFGRPLERVVRAHRYAKSPERTARATPMTGSYCLAQPRVHMAVKPSGNALPSGVSESQARGCPSMLTQCT